MIYQCYFKAGHEARLFTGEAYRGFGLEPEVNQTLFDHCPELRSAETRVALCEYGAFLHIWRNLPFDADDWIGFTSYRQLDKSDVVFESKQQIVDLLATTDLVAWHVCSLAHLRSGELRGIAAQTEIAHGMHAFTVDMLAHFGYSLPEEYHTAIDVPFANYWIVRKNRFVEFMEWSWPIVAHALAVEHAFKAQPARNVWDDKRKSIGYFAERLFVIWLMRTKLRCTWRGAVLPIKVPRPKRSLWQRLTGR